VVGAAYIPLFPLRSQYNLISIMLVEILCILLSLLFANLMFTMLPWCQSFTRNLCIVCFVNFWLAYKTLFVLTNAATADITTNIWLYCMFVMIPASVAAFMGSRLIDSKECCVQVDAACKAQFCQLEWSQLSRQLLIPKPNYCTKMNILCLISRSVDQYEFSNSGLTQ